MRKARLNGFKLPRSFVNWKMNGFHKRVYDIIRIRLNEKDFKSSKRNFMRRV